ncbi:hypothetical protein CPB83DRAFT_863764 [Crepidotus variabilis]|uniref:Uncharacterized protein n=1 Tax=Crepidotus variabilis TaxID=179855 RepID=A0A9P6E5M0_9AGAR|nr:hypothetical protein CPB83DRAFT_863764 [Crepidotus variabilis]
MFHEGGDRRVLYNPPGSMDTWALIQHGQPAMQPHLTSSKLYNQLPSLEVADKLFSDRSVLPQLRSLLDEHPDFGITLVHRHFALNPGQVMLTRGLVTQPEQPEIDPSNAFPSAWLATGEPFEYNVDPSTPALPIELLKTFQSAVKKLNIPEFERTGIPIVGICCAPTGLTDHTIFVERTEDKRNVVELRSLVDRPVGGWGITTVWLNTTVGCDCQSGGKAHTQACTDTSCYSSSGTAMKPTPARTREC